jgi:pSer/pThr/pTyr-binding forkhead associated (FHA) protein/Zn-dependent protease
MLCPSCRRQLDAGAGFCLSCGAPRPGQVAPLELVLGDRTRVPVLEEMTLGRAPGSTVVLDDPTVSRVHARISGDGNGGAAGGNPILEDAGSSHGTWVDGARISEPVVLRDGIRFKLGDQEVLVERRRDTAEAGRTIVVRPGASLVVPAMGKPNVTSQATQFGMRPRVRSGYALKRLEASEGNRRWVLKDLRNETFLRLSDNDAQLFEQLDGSRSLVDLIGESEQRFAAGPARLARLLADLGERGFLAGVEGTARTGAVDAPQGFWRRAFKPREKVFPRVGPAFERLYGRGGWLLFTRPALIAIAVLIVAGLGVSVYLIAGRYGTPFVVADKIGLGGLVFLCGRLLVVAIHECAHGLAMASFGRKVQRAGVKLLLIFPYAFVDTSEAWFEPRRRRIAISAAGPVSDFTIGALFAICCLLLPEGTVRDIFFNLAFAAYVGAFFNLNPFIDRDGYQILVDVLREPGLRRRAKAQFSRRLSGQPPDPTDSPVLARYSIFGLGWFVVMGFFAIGFSLRYKPIMDQLTSPVVVWAVLITIWVACFIPVFITVFKPLSTRFRGE